MGVAIRRAGEEDRGEVVRLLDQGFSADPVSNWVFPSPERLRQRHAALMDAFTSIALEEGHVDLAVDGTGCALWASVPAGAHGDDDDPVRFREAVDPDNERVEQIARLTAAVHPTDRAHAYLMMIAVSADVRGQGVGAALINSVLEECDRAGLPAYLEASSLRSRALYERLGFAFMGTPVELPGGPFMYPMWREPRG
ncbi:GNAT family N-acetyltransferase [Actinacidiphila yeochonensis]|uniref:GNAT family N-acetyltransferase n=1 Tax=Actinacidiphila yeochonensis TaxID=89050 RepID=UPI00055C68F6|nr:GNAT family N-acetyltransferase [Actinacidiphila yeochonensis]